MKHCSGVPIKTQPPGNRQNRVSALPWRLLTRGCIGGLVTIRLNRLHQLELPKQRLCLHNLILDLSLQVSAQRHTCEHLSQALLSRKITRIPPFQRWHPQKIVWFSVNHNVKNL